MAENLFHDGQTWVDPRENKTNGRQLYFHDKNLSNLIFHRGCEPISTNDCFDLIIPTQHILRQNVDSMLTTCWVSAWE